MIICNYRINLFFQEGRKGERRYIIIILVSKNIIRDLMLRIKIW